MSCRLLLNNVRTPDEREGDLVRKSPRAIREPQRLRKSALAMVESRAAIRPRLQNYSEQMMRAFLASAAGNTLAEDFLDNDGVTIVQ